MPPTTTSPNDKLKSYSLLIAGLVAMWGMFVMGWCTIQKIYVDVPMLLVLSNIVTGIISCITTVLVGRTIAQLNQGTTENPLKAEITNKDENPVPVEAQPKVETESKPVETAT